MIADELGDRAYAVGNRLPVVYERLATILMALAPGSKRTPGLNPNLCASVRSMASFNLNEDQELCRQTTCRFLDCEACWRDCCGHPTQRTRRRGLAFTWIREHLPAL